MGQTSHNIARCNRCRMHESLCVCAQIPQFNLLTKVVLVIHRREYAKISGTGPLAMECLSNSETLIHGMREDPIDLTRFKEAGRRLFFLYPRGGSTVLSTDLVQADSRPITLVVPDGNWRQAARMGLRLPGVEHATHVTLPPGQTTRWGLRKESRRDGLATFEAIARALGIIETPQIQADLEEFFQLMVGRVRKLRGR